jgi:hypothetical protein
LLGGISKAFEAVLERDETYVGDELKQEAEEQEKQL